MLENETGIMNTVDQVNFLKVSHEEKLNTGIGVIFFINGYTFAIIWSKSGYFLCDSHSRNEEGLITPDGTSILLKFKALNDVQNYIEEVYMLRQNIQVLTYQMQYINIETECTDIPLITSSVKKIKHRAQNRGYSARILGTPQHEKIKAQKRANYASIFGTPQHEKIKAQKRDKCASIFGTPKHENNKRQNRDSYAAISGTSHHEEIKIKRTAQEISRKNEATKKRAQNV